MKRRIVWRWLFLTLLFAWSIHEIYPPASRNLLRLFQDQAEGMDTTFTNIVNHALLLERRLPERTYADLLEAIGTNDITRYFPLVSVAGTTDPTRAILNRLARTRY